MPEPGTDLMLDGDSVALETELTWSEQQVALLLEKTAVTLPGWQLICIEDDDWLEQLHQALSKENA